MYVLEINYVILIFNKTSYWVACTILWLDLLPTIYILNIYFLSIFWLSPPRCTDRGTMMEIRTKCTLIFLSLSRMPSHHSHTFYCIGWVNNSFITGCEAPNIVIWNMFSKYYQQDRSSMVYIYLISIGKLTIGFLGSRAWCLVLTLLLLHTNHKANWVG